MADDIENMDHAPPRDDRRDARKQQLAASAISALQERGYANTTLRDVAKKSHMSLGMLHYYFKDKDELLVHCVEQFKQGFVSKIQEMILGASSTTEIVDAVSAGLVLSLIGDARTHRLWYDMRAQAMYEPVFREAVTGIEHALRDLFAPLSPGDIGRLDLIYGAVDGLFRYYLQRHLAGERLSPRTMETAFQELISRLL